MTSVKICGITTLEDAGLACDYGANAIGFIFFEPSPRYIQPAEAKRIIAGLPRDIAKVGVFVNPKVSSIRKTTEYCGLDFIQLSGDETPDFCRRIPASILFKGVSVDGGEIQGDLSLYRARAYLIDSREPGRFGGTGKVADWKKAKAVSRRSAVILAGGLNAENVGAAIAAVSPEAVDVSSGVEIYPGKKDFQKVRAFMDGVRLAGGTFGKRVFDRDPEQSEGIGKFLKG